MNGAAREAQEDTRVTVDSLQDWQRIKAGYSQAAVKQLDEELAARGLAHERDAHLAHLNDFLRRTFDYMRRNVRVNGRNLEDMDEGEDDFDLYDHALDRKVWSLSDQRMEWNKEVAMKRRTVPQQAEELVNDVLARQREADEEVQQALVIPESELAGPYVPTQKDFSEAETMVRDITTETRDLDEALRKQHERANRVKTVVDDLDEGAEV